MADEPKFVENPVITIEDIPGGGVSPDGKFVIIEFTALDGRTLTLQIPHHLADRLNLASAQFGHIAATMRETGEPDPSNVVKGQPVSTLQANLIRFQISEDGSVVRLIATGVGGPPLTIEFRADLLPSFQREVRKTNNLLRRIRKASKKRPS